MFLSKAERDFLLQRGEPSKNQQRYIRYKLWGKIKHFYNSELPLLIEQGYMVAGVAANSCGVTAGCYGSCSTLQLGKAELCTTAKACKLM
ncbi:MAG: hypothetical protein M3264_15330 [Thermoproteota archaeon]|nr:hypothetical protein [Thermoproteota archaeon]